jgi:hypothetical protein
VSERGWRERARERREEFEADLEFCLKYVDKLPLSDAGKDGELDHCMVGRHSLREARRLEAVKARCRAQNPDDPESASECEFVSAKYPLLKELPVVPKPLAKVQEHFESCNAEAGRASSAKESEAFREYCYKLLPAGLRRPSAPVAVGEGRGEVKSGFSDNVDSMTGDFLDDPSSAADDAEILRPAQKGRATAAGEADAAGQAGTVTVTRKVGLIPVDGEVFDWRFFPRFQQAVNRMVKASQDFPNAVFRGKTLHAVMREFYPQVMRTPEVQSLRAAPPF